MKSTFEVILSFAIEKEREAVEFYEELSRIAKRPSSKKMFEEFAKEETKHAELLEGVAEDKIPDVPLQKTTDLKISDYLIDVSFKPDIDYQDALIIAMKREEKAVRLYKDLAEKMTEDKIKNLLQFMAEEEAKHKLRLETEYDDNVLADG